MREVDHRAVEKLLRQGAVIVDVLPTHEYRSAHIRGAIHLPLARVIGSAPERLTRDRPTIVYCRDAL